MSLTDAGQIRDSQGEYLDDDGIAHGDVTGDLAAHIDAQRAIREAARCSVAAARRAGTGADVTGPPTRGSAATAVEAVEDRYAYRRSQVGGADLVERLIADGLASPGALDMDVDEVVWQVTEANAVDWNDPVDVHSYPRKGRTPLLLRQVDETAQHHPRGGDARPPSGVACRHTTERHTPTSTTTRDTTVVLSPGHYSCTDQGLNQRP